MGNRVQSDRFVYGDGRCRIVRIQLLLVEAELSDRGQELLELARESTPHAVQSSDDSAWSVTLWESDIRKRSVQFWVRCVIGWAERARRFGVTGLDTRDSTGVRGAAGGMIPTEGH